MTLLHICLCFVVLEIHKKTKILYPLRSQMFVCSFISAIIQINKNTDQLHTNKKKTFKFLNILESISQQPLELISCSLYRILLALNVCYILHFKLIRIDRERLRPEDLLWEKQKLFEYVTYNRILKLLLYK